MIKVKTIESNEDVNKSNKLYEDKTFNKLFDERMAEIYDLSKRIDFNNLTYYFKGKDNVPINFICFKGPLHFYTNIFNGDTNIEKAEKDKKQNKLDQI